MHTPNMTICPEDAAASDEIADFARFTDCDRAVAAGGEHLDCNECAHDGYHNDVCPALVAWARQHPDAPGAAAVLARHRQHVDDDRDERAQLSDLIRWAVCNPTVPGAADLVARHPGEAEAWREMLATAAVTP